MIEKPAVGMRRGLAVLLIIVSLTSGCAVQPDKHFADHAIRVNGDGKIVPVQEVSSPQRTTKRSWSPPSYKKFSSTATTNYRDLIRPIFDKAGESNKPLLIFVHGGLVSFSDSTERTNLLVQRYDGDARTKLDDYYPIMINWNSGLADSYFEHLLYIRQGEKWQGALWGTLGVLTSPLYFAADLGRSLVRAPIDILYTVAHNIGAIPSIRNRSSTPAVNSDILYKRILERRLGPVSRGAARTFSWRTLYRAAYNVFTFPIQAVLAPLIDGLGTPAWENMERRTKNIDNRPEEFDISKDAAHADEALRGLPVAVMTEFAHQLEAFTRAHPNVQITLVAHSMGTFIVNDMLRRTPDVNYSNIVYMAGADSSRDTRDSVVPYLEAHPQSQFFVLTLHPQAEVEEFEYFGFAPRGSLLVWIDDFFSSPLTDFDRTVGRWEDLIPVYGEIPDQVRLRVHIKAFDQTSRIQKHGDFGSACFWQTEFWQPGSNNDDPWTQTFYDDDPNACVRSQ
jgi:pimeloyl-ACP methyl ester carboxylesterase